MHPLRNVNVTYVRRRSCRTRLDSFGADAPGGQLQLIDVLSIMPVTSSRATPDIRSTFLQGAQAVLSQISRPIVAQQWDAASSLSGMTVGALASHVAQCTALVDSFLGESVPADAEVIDAAQFYARLQNTDDLSSPYNQRILKLSQDSAVEGPQAVVARLDSALGRMRDRINRAAPDAVTPLTNRKGQAMLLDEYLATRCVEIAVHLHDLAGSVGYMPHVPNAVERVAASVGTDAAMVRHGGGPVMDALFRGERAASRGVPVFPVL